MELTTPPARPARAPLVTSPGTAWLAVLVVAVGAVLFGLTWTPAVQVADSGELVTAACHGGVPHPPGYPLFTLLGQAFCRLPISTPAGRVGLLSLVAGVLALLALYGIVVRITGDRWAGALAALTLATGRAFWRSASYAEVFALHAALCLGALYFALRIRGARSPTLWSAVAGLLAGLCLSNHHSSVLILAVPVVAIVLPLRPAQAAVRRYAAALAGLLAGLSPYLYLLLTPSDRLPRWGDTSTLAGLWHHVLRRDYGTLSLSHASQPAGLENLTRFLAQVPHQLGWVLWPAALLGLVALFQRLRHRPLLGVRQTEWTLDRDLASALVAVPLLCGPAFMLLFNIKPDGIGAQVVERFYVLPSTALCVWLGLGLATARAVWLARPGQARRAWLWGVATCSALSISALAEFPQVNLRHSYAVEDYARNLLTSVDHQALVLGKGDAHWFSVLYVQQLLGQRPDVQYIDTGMLRHSWYVAQQQKKRPSFAFMTKPRTIDTVDVIQRALERGIPVYLATTDDAVMLSRFPGYPVGPLLRLLLPGARPPGPQQLAELNQHLFARFVRRGRLPDPAVDPWAASFAEAYARTWLVIGEALRQFGDNQGARLGVMQAQAWAPWVSAAATPTARPPR